MTPRPWVWADHPQTRTWDGGFLGEGCILGNVLRFCNEPGEVLGGRHGAGERHGVASHTYKGKLWHIYRMGLSGKEETTGDAFTGDKDI